MGEVAALVDWCTSNNLLLNLAKTKEMIIDFRKNKTVLSPLVISDQSVEVVNSINSVYAGNVFYVFDPLRHKRLLRLFN